MPKHSQVVPSEVVHLNLEYYRKQAKALLKSARAGDAAAVGRLPLRPNDLKTALHDAQLAIAREQGFPSWPRFKAFIEESQLNFQELVAAFIDAATSDFKRAETLLAANPKIEGAGFYVALVLGNAKEVESALVENPELAKKKSGPQNVEPLVYACFSRYAGRKSPRSAALVETVRVLLRYGADSNTSFTPEDLPNNPLSCLYAATGLNNNPELARVLLEAGATPNDGESLYHATEHADMECVKLLLKYGANVEEANALKHILDWEGPEGLKLLLEAGGDPNLKNENGQTALHWAVWRGRSAKIVGMLLDYGADINARRHDGRTAYALAAVAGRKDLTELLKARGADLSMAEADQIVADCLTAGPEGAKALLAAREKVAGSMLAAHLLPDLTMSHSTEAVRVLLAAGVPVNTRGGHGGTALHWACWKGYPDIVALLLEYGADLTLEDFQFHARPAGWLHHGAANNGDGADYAGVARLLLKVDPRLKACDSASGNVELDAVLRKAGIIS